jgi:hypothetical protein
MMFSVFTLVNGGDTVCTVNSVQSRVTGCLALHTFANVSLVTPRSEQLSLFVSQQKLAPTPFKQLISSVLHALFARDHTSRAVLHICRRLSQGRWLRACALLTVYTVV